jgi:two-component system cell cycle sensor histidine kinase/response regulator CckA
VTAARRGIGLLLPSDRLIAALLAGPGCCTALLDRHGMVLRRGGGWDALPAAPDAPPAAPNALSAAQDAFVAFAAPAPSLLRHALAAGQPISLDSRVAGVPTAISLTPVRAGRVAGVLRLTDRSREHDLAEALGQAQRLQEVGELAGGIAHDFNNLLTAILGAADDLSGHAAQADQPDLAQIRASATRGADLVRHLLAFSQRQTLQPRVLVLDEAVAATASLLRRLLGSRIAFELTLNAPGRRVHMDGTQLDQVLVNLAVNARNAMKDGGTLTIATGWRLVLAADDTGPDRIAPGRYATITITDTGAGIPPDVLPRIFDPFFTTRREEGGTGLGLSMVHGIIRQSGGALSVRSTPGQGTCFTITLPRYEPAAETAPPARAITAASGPEAGHVLLVDDDDAIRRLAARALTRAGLTVTEADGGEAALQVGCAAIDCLVSDVAMPGLDGPGLVRRLRAARPDLPAVLMSGYADAAQRRALAAEDIAFIAKPFAMADLTRTVAKLLSDARNPG